MNLQSISWHSRQHMICLSDESGYSIHIAAEKTPEEAYRAAAVELRKQTDECEARSE